MSAIQVYAKLHGYWTRFRWGVKLYVLTSEID